MRPLVVITVSRFTDGLSVPMTSHDATLLLIFMSDEMERLHPDVSRILHAGFQNRVMHAIDAADVQRPPSVGTSAYSSEEVRWCQVTFDFLGGQLDEEG
jgi:hypothetical protein